MKMKNFCLILLVIGLISLSCIANAALSLKDKDLLLYLPLNDDTDDYSTYKNNGSIVGTAKFVQGKIGKALEFTATGEVKCPYIELNDKSFTICMWINPKLEGAAEQCVFSQTQVNATNTSMHYRIYTNSTVRMGFYSNDLDAAGAVKAGQWVHIAFWLDVKNTSRKIYIDGVEVAKDAGKSGIFYKGNAGDTMIGSWGASGQKFNGTIDEVQVWNKPLTEDEIKQSMQDLMKLGAAVDKLDKLVNTWGRIKAR